MVRKLLFFLIAIAGCISCAAQDSTHLRISLLTCGPGDEEVWEVFGHTGVRVIDSVAHTDVVYNYGTFEFGPDFELQFMRGKLLYSLSIQTFSNFMEEYVAAKRKVEEQELQLDWKQKEHINYFLQWNAEPENRYYKYDFFFDNCATRIRDIFPRPEVFGNAFHYANVVPPHTSLTFRNIINQYFYKAHWTSLGVNILLGSRIDKVMTNSDIMFLPDYLRDGLAGATVNGKKVSQLPVVILPGNISSMAGINGAFLFTSIIALLTILGLTVKRLHILGKVMTGLLLLITGLLGCLILVMWFGTDHQGCSNNFNILWCLPTNIVLAFMKLKGKDRYALSAIIFIFISLLLSLFHIQGLIIEFIPILVALLFVYGTIYRSNKFKLLLANA